MEFREYQHVERFGTTETQGIEQGRCYVFPKIDGTNASLWMDGNELCGGSRKRKLSTDNDNAGFYAWALCQDNIIKFFVDHPELRLFGEWLVPHSLKTYRGDAWSQFYVFDVMDSEGNYLPYDTYSAMLEPYHINYIPPIAIIENGTPERFVEQLQKNVFLIRDDAGIGEGIVIKRYDFKNRYGRTTWAKIVISEFKEKHAKTFGVGVIKEKTGVEEAICAKYVTSALVEKEFAKLCVGEGWSSAKIPKLLGIVYNCLVTEECWNFVKHFKSPTVNFKNLQHWCNIRVKELKPEIF